MTHRLQLILMCIWIFFVIILIRQVKRRVFGIKHSLAWLLLDVVLIIITLFPGVLDIISAILGIDVATNMVFFFGLFLVVIIQYTHTIAISRISERQKEIVQFIALNEYYRENEGKNGK